METWNFVTENTQGDICKNLNSSLSSMDGFVFNIENGHGNSVLFKIRKRLRYAWYIIYHNNVIVNGRLYSTDTKNVTKVEITFKQHFLWKLVIFTHLILGIGFIIALISSNNTNVLIYIFAAVLIGIGIILWFVLRKKHHKNVVEYKDLIYQIINQ